MLSCAAELPLFLKEKVYGPVPGVTRNGKYSFFIVPGIENPSAIRYLFSCCIKFGWLTGIGIGTGSGSFLFSSRIALSFSSMDPKR